MNTAIDDIDRRIDQVLPELTNNLAQIMLQVRTHHRHNEKIDVLRSLVTQLERTTKLVGLLADTNAAHPASTVLRPVFSKSGVAIPGGSGKDGGSS